MDATRDGKHHNAAVTALVASLVALIVSFLVYFSLLSLLALKEEVTPDNRTVVERKVIGGVWVTALAKTALKKSGATRQRVFAGMGYDKDAMWPRASRTLARALVILAYLVFIPAGTVALATSGMVIAGS